MPPGDRRTRELPARRSAECSPDRFHSSRDPAHVFRCKRTDLHSTNRSGRAARCPIECCVKRWEFQDGESSQLLLGIREGAILNMPLSFLKSHRGPSLRSSKWSATDEDAGFLDCLVVGPPCTEVRIIFVS